MAVAALIGGRLGAADTIVPAPGQVSDAEARLTYARMLAQRNATWREAMAAYQRILRDEPGNATALAELAEISVRLGELPAAEQQFRAALQRRPEDATALVALAKLCLWTDRAAEAEKLLAEAARGRPLDSEGLLLRAQVLSRLGRHAESAQAFDALIASRTEVAPDWLQAAADARLAAGDIAAARELYARTLAMDANRPGAQRNFALTLAWTGRDAEARAKLAEVLRSKPDDYDVAVAYAEVIERTAGPDAAVAEIRGRLDAGRNGAWLLEWAEIEARRGHAVRSRTLFAQAFAGGEGTADMRLRRGRSAITWGDVATAEAALRETLAADPGNERARDDLGRLLLSFDRLPYAEQHYQRWLLELPDSRAALMGLVQVRMKQKDFAAALLRIESLRQRRPDDAEALALQGAALAGLQRDTEAVAVYQQMSERPDRRVDALLALGQLAARAGRSDEAQHFYDEARTLAPTRPAARFLAVGPKQVRSEEFVASLTGRADEHYDPVAPASHAVPLGAPQLVEWAGLYAEHGDFALAIRCLKAARVADPEYFPAWQQLAEFLAIAARYDEALAEFGRLRAAMPGNRGILLGEARALAWSRRYHESLDAYARLRALYPSDPEPVREAARVAGWGKERARGAELYAMEWKTPVDRALADGLHAVLGAQPANSEIAQRWRRWAAQPELAEEPFAFTGRFESERFALGAALGREGSAAIERLYVELLPALHVQRAFYLENLGKQLAWDRRFARGEDAFRRLVVCEPGNEEALFDLSQVQAAQGLGAREHATLSRLTALDANNSLANSALRRREIRSWPIATLEVRSWRESGRGDLASLKREWLAAEVSDVVGDQARVRVGAQLGRERPTTRTGRYAFRSVLLDVDGVVNNWLSGGAGFQHREFYADRIGHADSGHAELALNLRDAARIGVGYEKREELTNEFALFRGARSDNYWLGGSAVVTRRLDVDARFTSTRYSDDNRGVALEVHPALAWTDHPRIFKTILNLGYRDTERDNVYVYRGPQLVDIVHPYWAPQNYVGTSLTLEWYHDLAKEFFVGSQEHVYDLRVTFGTDTESNAGVTFEGDWRREWRDRWIAHASVYLNFSREWDATGLRLWLSRRL